LFKKLLFNDNCILDTDSNSVIFDFEDKWKRYLQWQIDNPQKENSLNSEKLAELNWNQGAVHKNGTEHKVFHKSGYIFDYKKYSIEGTLIVHNKYFYNGNVMSTYRKRGYLEIKEVYIDAGNKGAMLSSKLFVNNGTERKAINYYTVSNLVHTVTKRLSINSQIFKEYYDNGVLRAEGLLDTEKKMIGKWAFYSRDKIIESTHIFSKGMLVEKSYLYNQLGELTKTVYHG
jgi:antitoxin component YwqK of YwqJK toxin-antitoxin module